MKKIIILIMVFTLVLSSSMGAFAEKKGNGVFIDTSAVELTDVIEVPAGIKPIKFDSQEEFDDYIEMLQDESIKIQHFTIQEEDITSIPSFGDRMMYAKNFTSKKLVTKTLVSGGSRINLKAEIHISSSGSFGEITDVYEWTTHSGFTLFLKWVPNIVRSTIADDKQSCFVMTDGTIDTYIYVGMLVKVLSSPRTISFTYTL